MKYPLSWLREWTRLPDGAEELAARLTARGFPVDAILRLGHDYPGVVVGHVLEVARHPDADKLSLCRVDAGNGRVLSVVCGAPNVHAGMKAPLATVGAELPGGFKIKRSKIRGEVSEGMLCSARELELGGDHSGILSLRADAEPGRPVREIFGEPDAVLEIDIAYNRPDVLCISGLAREVAAAFEQPLAAEPQAHFAATVASGGTFPVRVEDPEGCPRYMAQVLRGVRVGPSPAWLAERIERAGMRPINNVVDVTNYVLLEMGHPLHAFDLATLAGPEIVVRRGRPGEPITTLDGRARTLTAEHLVIADRDRPTVIAGVMGAAHVEVGEGTTDILLEAAWFDPVRIQRAVSDHGIMSEAARRYGRGVDPALTPAAMARAIALLEELAGARCDGPATDVRTRGADPVELELTPAHVSRLLGVRLGRERIARDLAGLGFGVTDPLASGGDALLAEVSPGPTGGNGHDSVPLVVTVPTRRRDVTRAVDLIEEVARAFGYDKLPDVPLATGGSVGTRPAGWRLRERAVEAWVGLGFTECLTPSLDDPARLSLTWPLLQPGEPRFVQVRNAAGPETSTLRTDLVSGLLRVAAHNLRHGAAGLRLFEIGRVFAARPAGSTETLPEERWQVAALLAGSRFHEAWDGGQAAIDFFEAKGIWEAFLARLDIDSPTWSPYAAPGWKSGEAAKLQAKLHVASAGRLSPRLAQRLDLEVPVHLFVADLEDLAAARRGTRRFRAFPRLPAVTRDVAFFVPQAVEHASIEAALREAGGALLTAVRLFDVYAGKGVPEGCRSLAFTLTFQAPDRTLTEGEVETLQQTIVDAVVARFGATLRDR